MTKYLLALNVGSSSVKFALYAFIPDLPLHLQGSVKNIGTQPVLILEGTPPRFLDISTTQEDAIRLILETLGPMENLSAAVHRVVHGGKLYSKPTLVDRGVLDKLGTLIPLAPLHQPHNLAGMEILAKLAPLIPQIATFDTAFHANRCALTTTYALSQTLRQKGIERYGFHGLSYEWCARTLERDYPDIAQARVIAAHLGSGVSVCALRHGKSVDTSMGMTALEGPPMGTRSGNLDPGALLYMMDSLGMSAPEVGRCLYQESGLKGLSGISGDVKVLLESQDPRAFFALEHFAFRVAQYMAMMAVSLGGVDAFVFTGGIGEKAPSVREDILHHLAFLGPVPSCVIIANEERVMAMHAYEILCP